MVYDDRMMLHCCTAHKGNGAVVVQWTAGSGYATFYFKHLNIFKVEKLPLMEVNRLSVLEG